MIFITKNTQYLKLLSYHTIIHILRTEWLYFYWKQAEEDAHTENQMDKAHLDNCVKEHPERGGT